MEEVEEIENGNQTGRERERGNQIAANSLDRTLNRATTLTVIVFIMYNLSVHSTTHKFHVVRPRRFFLIPSLNPATDELSRAIKQERLQCTTLRLFSPKRPGRRRRRSSGWGEASIMARLCERSGRSSAPSPRNKPVILKVVPYLIILIVATSLLTTKHVPKSRDFSKECGVSVLAGAA